jgi:protocatechuate 3,4-dioxygenase beta subunit
MQIDGTVFDSSGRAVPGVIVYAYHTNAAGLYPHGARPRGEASYRHGRLRGWAITDENGRYRFLTVRPAGYPDTDLPQHVHMHVIEVGCCTYYIDDILFTDDPRLTPRMREQLTLGRGGSGVATPRKDTSGTWMVTRDIVLGANIPGYPACGRGPGQLPAIR